MTRRCIRTTVLLVVVGCSARPALAQLDPLLFLKGTRPNVLIGLDLSSRMLRDEHERYYDPVVYRRQGEAFEATLGLNSAIAVSAYRRRYVGLRWLDPFDGPRATADSIEVLGDQEPGYAGFDDRTRWSLARRAVIRAIEGNRDSTRFGLLTTRLPLRPAGDDRPRVLVDDLRRASPTDTGESGVWSAGFPVVAAAAASAPPGAPVVRADAANANGVILGLLGKDVRDAGGLVPAGADTPASEDAPLGGLLDDLYAEAERLIKADTTCRNTVIVLVVGGGSCLRLSRICPGGPPGSHGLALDASQSTSSPWHPLPMPWSNCAGWPARAAGGTLRSHRARSTRPGRLRLFRTSCAR
ncbi:MAG TPA: hypothetical protein VGK32_07830 [Vicinamibacterales bacterium]|jgi:hypothetical protein